MENFFVHSMFIFTAIDVDYDLYFYSSTQTGQASLPYPVALDLESFTFSLWVRFREADSTGTFLMAFTVS